MQVHRDQCRLLTRDTGSRKCHFHIRPYRTVEAMLCQKEEIVTAQHVNRSENATQMPNKDAEPRLLAIPPVCSFTLPAMAPPTLL